MPSFKIPYPSDKTVRLWIAMELELVSDLEPPAIARSLASLMGKKQRWQLQVAKGYRATFANKTRPTQRTIVKWLESFRPLQRALSLGMDIDGDLSNTAALTSKSPWIASWKLPDLSSLDDLCRLVEIESMDELEWLVAPNKNRGLNLQHYQTQLLKKRRGGYRLVESPRSRLKFVQKAILHQILDKIPPHDDCFGFTLNRNVKQFASVHCGQDLVLRMDLQDFFPSVATGRVHATWRTLGYGDQVAKYLTWLCTVPPKSDPSSFFGSVPQHYRCKLESQCSRDRLPQGAPTSGAIANQIAYRMDCRLSGMARKTGGRYARYADDLAFSWPSVGEKHAEQLTAWIAACIAECGFQVNFRKSCWMHRSQKQMLAGIVVNKRPNLERNTIDQLRALLFNCIRNGPESQNRSLHPNFREHLIGRIAWVTHINPATGERLEKLFDQINW